MNFRWILFIMICFHFLFHEQTPILAQNYFGVDLDTTVFKTDTIIRNHLVIVNYYDQETKNRLEVCFKSTAPNKANGFCRYRRNDGLKVEGYYKEGQTVGEWVEKNSSDSVLQKVNYDYEHIHIPENLLIRQNSSTDKKDTVYVKEIPSFNEAKLLHDLKENLFLPAAFRFFHRDNSSKKVFVKFDIVQHEKVANVKCVVSALESELMNEAIRLIYSTQGSWKNSMHRRIPSDVSFIIPIHFNIKM